MKLLRITAAGLPLFKDQLDIAFWAQQRVSEEEKPFLISLPQLPAIHLSPAIAIAGINASGKTSTLKVSELALSILASRPINHIEARTILCDAENAVLTIYFLDICGNICQLESRISSRRTDLGGVHYTITDEKLWQKAAKSVASKKGLCDFSALEPIAVRGNDEMFLPDDVSFVIAYNRKTGDQSAFHSLIPYTNGNVLQYWNDITPEIVSFLDPNVEMMRFERDGNKTGIHLKYFSRSEMVLTDPRQMELYLSSGTIKGIVAFSYAREALKSGGYLLMDEIESHLNKETAATLMRFFLDQSVNTKGACLVFSTHYPELLDEYDRNDAIYITRNRNGITVENLCSKLKRNDVRKSDAYQSGLIEGTTPDYEAYIKLKNSIKASID